MRSISFDFDSSDLEESLKIASRQFPASAEIVLKKESRKIAKDLKGRVDSEAKGHHYAEQGAAHKPLAKSFRQGKVIRSGSKVTVAVTTTAPHYHLYEKGHAMITHKSKDRTHGLRQVGEVKGNTNNMELDFQGENLNIPVCRFDVEFWDQIPRKENYDTMKELIFAQEVRN